MRLVGSLFSLAALAGLPAAHTHVKVDACSLITPAEATTALGVPVQQAHHLFPTTTDQCFWSDIDSADPDHRRVTVSIIPQQSFEISKTSPRRKSEPVSGVGDDALYVYPGGTPDPWIYVKKGNVYFIVRVLNGMKVNPKLTPADVKAKELVLAKAAAGRV